VHAWLLRETETIAAARGVRFELGQGLATPAALMDLDIITRLEQAMARTGQAPTVMPSGGGHDAAVISSAGVPSGMIFVRNRNGSQNPREAMEIDDFLQATAVLSAYLAA